MSGKNIETEETPAVCSIKGMRSIVFKKAHEKAKDFESKGDILMHDDWKKILSETWVNVTKEVAEICKTHKEPMEETIEVEKKAAFTPPQMTSEKPAEAPTEESIEKPEDITIEEESEGKVNA